MYTKCEYVMPASNLAVMNGSMITSMTCYNTKSNISFGSASFKVFMKEVDFTTLDEFQGYEDATVVYEGSLFLSSLGLLEIEFTTPFEYHGGNLLIGVYNCVPGSSVGWCYYYGENVEGATIVAWNGESLESISMNAVDIIGAEVPDFLPKTTFTYTNTNLGGTPTGAINGIFSVSDSTQVYFSQGNLQYIGSAETPYWKFADHQWDCLGTTTGQNSADQNVDRDLFGWGTSGYDHGATCYQPWSTSESYSDYFAYGSGTNNLFDQTGQADWGYNDIINGGNIENQWRTLERHEWDYLWWYRPGIRYAHAQVNDVNGTIIFPDSWDTTYYKPNNYNSDVANCADNVLTIDQWLGLEQHGAVFLPAAGYRRGTSVNDVGSGAIYWSSTRGDNYAAIYTYPLGNYYYWGRYNGFSVRLVCSASQGFTSHWIPNSSDYEENMPITAVVEIDGVEQQSTLLELGAFCGEECRGSQMPLYFEPTQRYIYQMTVFGEEGDEITFRLYDHTTQQELDLVAPDAITFTTENFGYGTLPDPVVLNFRHSYDITATANPEEGGTVEGGGTYIHGETCTLTATANTGYHFVNWTLDDEEVSTEAEYSFEVTGEANFVANFELNSYEITATANPIEGGTVTGAGLYNHFSTCTLTATANTGYHFVNWTLDDEDVSTEAEYSFEVTGEANFVANFELNSYEITATANPTESGTVTGAGLYNHFSTCTLTATANEDYVFVSWTLGGEVVSNSPTYSFEVTGTGDYVAHFDLVQTTNLSQGWNWWSAYVELNGSEGLEALEDGLGANGIFIKSQNDGYVSYMEDLGWYGSLGELHNEQSYRVKANAACTVSLQGLPTNPVDYPVGIASGWTWMGFPWSQSVSVESALEGFEPEANDLIKGRNAYTMYYNENGYSLWFGPLNSLEPGQGYVYYSNSGEAKTLTLNTNGSRTAQPNVTADDNLFRPEVGNYADNMTLTAVVDLNGKELVPEPVEGPTHYEVAAFCNGECRGSARLAYFAPTDSHIAFLTLYGNEDDALEFVLTDGTMSAWSGSTLQFTTDGRIGTLTEPYTLCFGVTGIDDNGAAHVTVYPNPSKDVFNIKGEGIRRIDVFNAFGQAVFSEETDNEVFRIDLSDKAAGVYLLRVVTESGVTNQQLIKE